MPSVKGILHDGRTSQRLTTKIQFIAVTTGFASANAVIRPAFKEVYSSIDGSFNVRLNAGRYVVKCGGITLTEIIVPSGEGTYGIDALIATGTVAPASGNFLQLTGGTMTGDIIMSHLTADRVALIDSTKRIYSSSVTTATLGYLDATSSIQTQLNIKATGAASSTDNALARFDGTGGKTLQNSSVTVDDNGNFTINSDLTWERASVTWPLSVTAHRWSGKSFDFLATAANEEDYEHCVMTFSRPVAGRIGFLSWRSENLNIHSHKNLTIQSEKHFFLGPSDSAYDLQMCHAGKNITMFGAPVGTSGVNILAIRGLGATAPTTSPADVVQLWCNDRDATAGKAGLHLRSEDGTSHVFADRVGLGTLTPGYFLDVVGDMRVGSASGAAGSRIIGRGEHTSAPAASLATGEWELTVFDNGTTPVFRVRYNDGGTIKSVDLGPLS